MLYFSIIFWIIKIISDAAIDTLSFKYNKSIFSHLNSEFWNPKRSYRNKFKNKMPFKGSAYFGSQTIFAFLTDGFHLLRFISYTSAILSAIFLMESGKFDIWYEYILLIILGKITYDYIFFFFYRKIFS